MLEQTSENEWWERERERERERIGKLMGVA